MRVVDGTCTQVCDPPERASHPSARESSSSSRALAWPQRLQMGQRGVECERCAGARSGGFRRLGGDGMRRNKCERVGGILLTLGLVVVHAVQPVSVHVRVRGFQFDHHLRIIWQGLEERTGETDAGGKHTAHNRHVRSLRPNTHSHSQFFFSKLRSSQIVCRKK